MKFIAYISLAALLLISACGEKKDDLSKKRAELEKLKTEIAKLQSKAKTLESEIEKLDPKKDGGKLVETETLKPGLFNSYLAINGKADADQSTIATSQVPSTVIAVLVQPGASVRAGQALAYLDAGILKQNRLLAEQQVTFATTLYNKQKRLWEQGIGTEVQYISAKNQKEAAEKSLAALDAQIAMYTVKSPINGTVESVDIKIGQTAAPGMPLFKVVNLSQLKVTADVAESYSGKINTGDKVLIYFPDLDKKVESKIKFTSKVIDPLNRTFHVEVHIPPTAGVKPNMIARLQIIDYSNPKAITVPTNCIQSAEDEKYVVIVEQKGNTSVARRMAVKTGHTGDERTEITEGLQTGSVVVVNGYQELIDGQVLNIQDIASEIK